MKILIVVTAAVLVFPTVLRGEQLESGNLPLVTIDATPFEQYCAVTAMAYVLAAYADLGAELSPADPCRIIFQDRITVDGIVIEGVLGRYDSRTATVYMLHFESEDFQESEPDSLPDLATKFRLVVAHEFTHYLNARLPVRPDPVLDECIAGYFQYAWLDDEILAPVLESATDYRISSPARVSMLAYRDEPDNFLLAGYLYFRNRPAMLDRCLRGNPPLSRDPMSRLR